MLEGRRGQDPGAVGLWCGNREWTKSALVLADFLNEMVPRLSLAFGRGGSPGNSHARTDKLAKWIKCLPASRGGLEPKWL